MCARRWLVVVVLGWAVTTAGAADGPADNVPEKVRPVPPPGIAVPVEVAKELEAGLAALAKSIAELQAELRSQPGLLELLPDVEIYHKAVAYALEDHEFYHARELAVARTLLEQGQKRAAYLRRGEAPWTTATGQVVRGYRSRIDGSVQPYGLVVPASYTPTTAQRFRLDAWFHGRGENLTELNFIDGRQRNPGDFTPRHTFVLHPYGRYCNANKFAGEIDLFEALEHVRRAYPIDENRLVMRGFSMGGAACWQFAVHYAGRWAAAAPGAGFAETPEFLRVFQNEKVQPADYEQRLWHWYDCTDYALNLFNCPTVAYSGEIDKQKQAADVMAAAMLKEGLHLVHIIGPKTGHAYHPQAREEINRRIDAIADRGREPTPAQVKFTTWTLRYDRLRWVRVDGLDQHWEPARVDAAWQRPARVELKTRNISAVTLTFPPGGCPLDATATPTVVLDDQALAAPPVLSDRSWEASFHKEKGAWAVGPLPENGTLRKRHGLQGPIDDAFMDRFLMVRPTGKPWHAETARWVEAEMQHAVRHWRLQFRGDPKVVDDSALTDVEIASSNLVLWGDPGSNRLLARIADRLPVRWDAEAVHVGAHRFEAAHHMPVLIFPNPLNPKRYVVLNSGFTFREYDYLNNARQVPKLPDYAVIDIRVPVSSRAPGGIATAGFFDEHWRLAGE